MNSYIQNRINLEKIAIIETCGGCDLDEKYSGALWDWAGEIAKSIKNETLKENIQCEIYYALNEVFETIQQGGLKND